jgi:hypothetical protein
MPSAKAKLKIVAQAASNTHFVNIPRLSTLPNYKQWLNELYKTNPNKKTFASTEKIEIDGLLRLQANRQFKNDSSSLDKAQPDFLENRTTLTRTVDNY